MDDNIAATHTISVSEIQTDRTEGCTDVASVFIFSPYTNIYIRPMPYVSRRRTRTESDTNLRPNNGLSMVSQPRSASPLHMHCTEKKGQDNSRKMCERSDASAVEIRVHASLRWMTIPAGRNFALLAATVECIWPHRPLLVRNLQMRPCGCARLMISSES